jgi:hypothetical protein
MSIDYRISVEELEREAEIAEMARNLVREALEETPKHLVLTEEEENVPFLIK